MKKILIYLMMAWWVFPGSLSAAKIAVFGPQTYVRTTGAPDQYAEVFDTTALEGILTIRNGEAAGSHRITSAIITLNDQQIFSPKDFKQHDHLLEAPIPIQETNQLDIELRSKPGEYLTIEITPTVQPPVITSSPVVTGTEGTPYLYDVEAMDPDDDVLQYSLVKCPGGMTINNTSGLMEWLPTREQVGEHEITIEVADTDGLSATQTYIVSVISANHAPILTPVENCMMDEDSTLEVGVSATDEDGDELAFTVTGLPSFGAFTDNGDGTGAISFAPGPDTIGRYAICVVVSDRIESVSDFFILTVDQTGLLGTYYNHSQGHPDMQVWNGGRNMVESMLTDNAPTLNVSGQSSYNQFDWWDEEYRVFQRLDSKTDLQNAFGAGRRWFPVNTGLSGDPYHFAVHWQGRFYVDEDKTYTYKMGSDDDAWVYIDNQLTLDLGGIHALSWTSDNVPLTKGFHDIDIFFAERHTSQSGFQLNFFSDLFSPPDPPVADFDFSQPILKDQPQSAAVLVDGSGSSNPDGDRLTCLWYGPFETQGGVAPVLRVPQGNYRVSLIVDNGVATSEVETLETTVHPCFYLSSISKPGEVSLDWNPVEGAEQYRIYRSTDTDPLSLALIGETADTDFTDDNADHDHTYLYVVGALFQDGVGFSDIISRHPAGGDEANQRPVIYSSPVLNGTVGLSYTCDVNATDPDNDLISYQLTGNPDGMKIDPATGLISWIPPQAGSYEVTVQASDHNGGRDTQAFSIIVEPIKTTVPEVTGLTRAEASVEIAYAFSKVQSITEEYNDTVPAGVVIRQTPLAGSIIPLYAGVELVVSLGTRMTTIPDVAGMSRADAESAIIAAQLAVGDVTRDYSPDTPRGHVISQHPEAGICLPVDSTIDIVVSLGPEIVTVPDVSGLTLAEATAALNAETLSPGQITEVYISTPPAGIVFDQTPAAGTQVQHDTTVDVKISLGPWTGPDNDPPKVSVTATPADVSIGDSVTITVTATDNVGVVSRQLTIDGEPVSLTNGQAEFLPEQGGFLVARATATDAAGLTGTDEEIIAVADPNDTAPPTVLLDAADCPEVTDLYAITGQVADSNGVTYTLASRRQGTDHWNVIVEQTGSSFSGELGVFDPSLRPNGVYEILLSAEDPAGNVSSAFGCLVVDGNLKLGALTLPATDLSIPAPGMPLTLERVYDSRITEGDFGPGWQLPSSTIKPMTTRSLSGGWAEEIGGSMLTTYYLVETYRHVVVIRFSDEEVLKFKMDVTPKSSVMLPYSSLNLTATYTPLDGTQGALKALNAASSHLMLVNNQLLEYGSDPYDPVRFQLTRPDGSVYIVHMENGLERVTDPHGHTINYSSDGVQHSSGASLTFERGAGDRIEKITDHFGREITYYYNEDGLLEKAVQTGAVNPYLHDYVYQGRKLEAIEAPDGTRLGSFEYDPTGRLTALIDADGNRIIYGHDIESHTQEITDRLGRTTTYQFDSRGNVTRQVDPLGHETQWTYDDHDNKLSKTDPLGLTTNYTYDDHDNLLTETDPLGHTTSYTYNDAGNVLTTTDPRGNVTTNTYNAAGDLLSTTDAAGHVTSHTYDADGNMTSTTDKRGYTTTYEHDGAGNRVKEIDPLGNVTTWAYDDYGNQLTETKTRTRDGATVTMTTEKQYDRYHKVIKTIDPYGYESTTEYNYKVDKKSAETAKTGVRTEYDYDDRGNLLETRFADGSAMLNTYDAEGNRASTTDRNGNTTRFVYDDADRLVRTEYPDGAYSEMVYDVGGRLATTIDENGNQTDFAYEDAGRRTRIIDSFGNTTAFTYDASGNQTALTDAMGRTTSYEYDALNRKIRTIYPDGTLTRTAYDAEGNKISETDQNGNVTRFEYDAKGNLTAVIDTAGNRSEYIYDEVGNKLAFTDANGNTEHWSYDDLGRVSEHTLPLGMTESFTYDPNGNVLTHTDCNGDRTEYGYSICCHRLTDVYYPDGTRTTYTYLPAGQRESVTDQSGTTWHDYDARNRLVRVTHPDGTSIDYTYDPAGNRTSVQTPSGTTTHTYDGLNRLSSVTAADGGVTTYSYDAVGNRAGMAYPNGVLTTYAYDDLNRLTYLETANADGQVISSYAYTLDAAGHRVRVEEHDGRVVDYTYDTLYRLIAEDIIDPVNGSQHISYTYDAVGNRLTRADATGMTTYTYDINNRLLTETGPDGTFTYAYDANGNQIQKQSVAVTVDYGYDYDNRLISVDEGATVIEYQYDPDGIRARKTVNGLITDYLVDKNRDYAQVLEERDGSGSLVAGYVYGDDLISQERGGTKSYYHYDGLGSTRALTDDRGAATDTYNYEAFGTLLNQTGTTGNNYLFTGEQYDPNAGFYYLRARWMNPETGRFITTDPFEGVQNDPVTLHKYLYAGMNPVMNVDPSGKFSMGSLTTGMAISSVLVSTNLSVVTGILHLIDTKKPIKWHGTLSAYSGGLAGIGGGKFKIRLTSACRDSKKAEAEYTLILFGLTYGIPFSHYESDITMTTPGILGVNPYVLTGHCQWTSGSAIGRHSSGKGGGFHSSLSSLYMGTGIAKVEWPLGAAEWGIALGVDFMGGVSIGNKSTFKDNRPCP